MGDDRPWQAIDRGLDLPPLQPPLAPVGEGQHANARFVRGLGAAAGALLVAGLVGLPAVTARDRGTAPISVTSGTGRQEGDAAVVAASAAATRAAGTVHIRATSRTVEAGEPVEEITEGVTSLDGRVFDMTYWYAPGKAPSWDDGTSTRVMSDGTTVWYQVSDRHASGSVPPGAQGKRWIAEPVDYDLSSGYSDGLLGFELGDTTASVLDQLSAVSAVRKAGEDRVGGVRTTRYELTVDIDAVQRSLPRDERSFDGYDLRTDVAHTFPATAWIDGDGRLRRLTYRLDLGALLTAGAIEEDYAVEDCPEPDPALLARLRDGDRAALDAMDARDDACTSRPPSPAELVIEGTLELSDFGVNVEVKAPPASEVQRPEDEPDYRSVVTIP